MNVLLSHAYFLTDDPREQQIMRPYPPLGILYISAYLEKHGIENQVYDSTFSSREQFYQYLTISQPSIIGLYTNLMTKMNVLELIKYIKCELPDTVIILGGPDVRYNANNYLQGGAHFIVVGEGEQTMLELVQGLQAGTTNFTEIQGIGFLKNEQLVLTREREKLKELDTLPFPNRNKIDLSLYLDAWKKFHGTNALSVSTMRGCPYTCKWCSRGVYGLSYRRRSPSNVVEELAMIKNAYNPDSIWFVDDVFTISHRWLEGFRDTLQQNKISIKYECITRADRMNEAVVKMLKETGCFRVWIGAESGSQKVIDLMDRRVNVDQVRDMIKLCKHYGIQAGTFIMLGYPGETEQDIHETVYHLKESDPDYFTITIAYPIKGTEMYQEVESDILNLPEWNASTDRQIDFRRTYSRKYYDYAVRWVTHEVNFSKSVKNGRILSANAIKLKSLAAKAGMWWEKTKSHSINPHV